MVLYSLLDAVRDFIGLASTVTVVVWLICGFQPLFEKVKDSCRDCQPPEGRALLLWSAFLIPIAWVTAAALYFHHLFSLWDLMGTILEKQPVNRQVYALLHLYLFFLLLCGFYVWVITDFEIFRHRQVYNDLFMIARSNPRRHQAVEDLEAQHNSSSTDPIDAEAETHSAVGNVCTTSLLPQNGGSHRSGQNSNEDVAPTEARINEPEHLIEETAWLAIDSPVGEIINRTVISPIQKRSVKCSSWPIGCGWNNSEAAGPSNQHNPTLDSDGDAITMTPSSSSSSNASSGIDELEYVDDDDGRYGLQGVRLREPVGDRKQKDTSASYTMDWRRYVEDNNDDDPYGLYYVTPRLSPQDQNGRTDIEPLDIGAPPSPCDSCSSARAESIPTAKRSPVRVPITPTSPTADADDADTEKTDVERKQRERKTRNPAMSAPQSPHAHISRTSPPYGTNIISLRIDPYLGDDEKNTSALESHHTAHDPEHRDRPAASTRASSKSKPKPSPMSVPAVDTRPAHPPLDWGKQETGLIWRSREAENSASAASRDENADVVSFDGRVVAETRAGVRRRIQRPVRSPQRKRAKSPYPMAEGRQGPRDLSLEIPDAGNDSHGREEGR